MLTCLPAQPCAEVSPNPQGLLCARKGVGIMPRFLQAGGRLVLVLSNEPAEFRCGTLEPF